MVSQIEDKHKEHPAPGFCNQKPEAELNVMAAFPQHTRHTLQPSSQWSDHKPDLLYSHTSHTSTVRPTNEPSNHYGFANMGALQSECLIDSNFSLDNHHQHVHNACPTPQPS